MWGASPLRYSPLCVNGFGAQGLSVLLHPPPPPPPPTHLDFALSTPLLGALQIGCE